MHVQYGFLYLILARAKLTVHQSRYVFYTVIYMRQRGWRKRYRSCSTGWIVYCRWMAKQIDGWPSREMGGSACSGMGGKGRRWVAKWGDVWLSDEMGGKQGDGWPRSEMGGYVGTVDGWLSRWMGG
jgi:hypothetical protein